MKTVYANTTMAQRGIDARSRWSHVSPFVMPAVVSAAAVGTKGTKGQSLGADQIVRPTAQGGMETG